MPLPEFDFTEWTFWWEFNKAPYLRLKEKLARRKGITRNTGILCGLRGFRREGSSLLPSPQTLKSVVVPALKRALSGTRRRDIVTSCLVALAKIGGTSGLGKTFRKFLSSPDQEVSETAVLCLGLSGGKENLPLLESILLDTPKGRALVKDPSGVHFRKRAFAAYALGLLARAHELVDVKEEIFEILKTALQGKRFPNRDVPVACVLAIRLLRPREDDPLGKVLSLKAAAFLLDSARDPGRSFLVRAHSLEGVARLLGRGGPAPRKPPSQGEGRALTLRAKRALLREKARAFLKDLLERGRENSTILQSAVLALGEMGDPSDGETLDLLVKTAGGKGPRDLQTRFFANIALAYLGAAGAEGASKDLVSRLVERGRKVEKPWIALALGVNQAELLLRKRPPTPGAEEALLAAFGKLRNPSRRAAVAVALGLAQCRKAGAWILREMERSRVPSFKGYCALSLGLMGYGDAVGVLRAQLEKSLNLPVLLRRTAVALGLLGEKSVVPDLLGVMARAPRNLAVLSSLAIGLGLVGDRRTIPALTDMLFDKNLTDTTRAFAAVALGIVGERWPLPWNSGIARGLNYRAAVETLVGGANGILDIL